MFRLSGVLSKMTGDSVTDIENLKRPRHIKSHLPIMMLPNEIWTKKPKVCQIKVPKYSLFIIILCLQLVYIARNPKDAATSFFYHYRNIVGCNSTKEQFFDAFLNDNLIYAPFIKHVDEYWQMRNEPNVLFVTYEEMKKVKRII